LVEYQRRHLSLHAAAAAARRRVASKRRTSTAREQLRYVIAAVDRRLGARPNCVRRALLEMSLDSAAASDKLLAGFKAGGGDRSGHAWLASHPEQGQQSFDAIISI
jgi:hypothetical protein